MSPSGASVTAGTDHRQKRGDAAGAQQAMALLGGPPVEVTAGSAVGARARAVWAFHGEPYPDAVAG